MTGNSANNYAEISESAKFSKYKVGTGFTLPSIDAGKWKTTTTKQYYWSGKWACWNGTSWVAVDEADIDALFVSEDVTYVFAPIWIAKASVTISSDGNTSVTIKDSYEVEIASQSTGTFWFVKESNTLTITPKAADGYEKPVAKINNSSVTSHTITGDVTISLSSTKTSCITGDTLITLADGTKKRVDQLTGNENLLVWNLETGKYEAANIVFVDSEEEMVYEIIHLYFSDGSEVKVISEHGFFDINLAEYVYIDVTNYSEYIGHRFVTEGDINSNTWNEATLINVVIEHKVERAWSPVTFKQLCYYTNGVLSMPGGIAGLFNIFEVDTETMTYDAEKMQADIEMYGLFTLEDFGGMIPEIAFEAFNGAWLKVAIGKGMLTWEDIAYLAERYMPLVDGDLLAQ